MSTSDTFARSGFARFMNSWSGRLTRLIVGLALLVLGFTQRGSSGGTILIILGLIPFVAGLFDLCLVSAIVGGPIRGALVRMKASGPRPK